MSLQVFNDSSAATSAKGMFVDITWSNNKQNPPKEKLKNLYAGDKVLSDYVTIIQAEDKKTGFEIHVNDDTGNVIYELKGLVLDEF